MDRTDPRPQGEDPMLSRELSDEDLEVVVGGLTRAWVDPSHDDPVPQR